MIEYINLLPYLKVG